MLRLYKRSVYFKSFEFSIPSFVLTFNRDFRREIDLRKTSWVFGALTIWTINIAMNQHWSVALERNLLLNNWRYFHDLVKIYSYFCTRVISEQCGWIILPILLYTKRKTLVVYWRIIKISAVWNNLSSYPTADC